MRGTGCTSYRRAISRRALLGAGVGGLSLPAILQTQAPGAGAGGIGSDTAVIQYWLNGAASQFETFDPKPDAPTTIRGPFNPISTNVAGVHVCETLPLHARLMDKVTVIRSMRHDNNDHQHGMHWCHTGHDAKANGVNPFKRSSHPSSGSVTAKVRGSNHPGMPPYVSIGYPIDNHDGRRFPRGAAYLGFPYEPFVVLDQRTGDGKDPGRDRDFRMRSFDLTPGLTHETLANRRGLLERLDTMRRDMDRADVLGTLDHFQQVAFDMLTGPRARNAFDLDREDQRTRDRYGPTRPGQTALLARRLVEAGVTFVHVIDPGLGTSSSGWDLHQRLEWGMKTACPRMDQAVTALIEDLHLRGLDKRVLLVVWGEFGRTPKINEGAGRDHWAGVQSVLVAGGGINTGQVIGSSTAGGEMPKDRPLWPYDMLATMYHHLGIDPSLSFDDGTGRPIPILSSGEPIAELF